MTNLIESIKKKLETNLTQFPYDPNRQMPFKPMTFDQQTQVQQKIIDEKAPEETSKEQSRKSANFYGKKGLGRVEMALKYPKQRHTANPPEAPEKKTAEQIAKEKSRRNADFYGKKEHGKVTMALQYPSQKSQKKETHNEFGARMRKALRNEDELLEKEDKKEKKPAPKGKEPTQSGKLAPKQTDHSDDDGGKNAAPFKGKKEGKAEKEDKGIKKSLVKKVGPDDEDEFKGTKPSKGTPDSKDSQKSGVPQKQKPEPKGDGDDKLAPLKITNDYDPDDPDKVKIGKGNQVDLHPTLKKASQTERDKDMRPVREDIDEARDMQKVIGDLRRKTVKNGATPGEAAAAKAKADQLEKRHSRKTKSAYGKRSHFHYWTGADTRVAARNAEGPEKAKLERKAKLHRRAFDAAEKLYANAKEAAVYNILNMIENQMPLTDQLIDEAVKSTAKGLGVVKKHHSKYIVYKRQGELKKADMHARARDRELISFFKKAPVKDLMKFANLRTETELCINGHSFLVEWAATPSKRELGLMYRDSMPANHGMMFDFEEERQLQMWMKNTHIPLDMLFINSEGVIVDMACNLTESETIIQSDVPARFVLELNAGTVLEKGIQISNRIDEDEDDHTGYYHRYMADLDRNKKLGIRPTNRLGLSGRKKDGTQPGRTVKTRRSSKELEGAYKHHTQGMVNNLKAADSHEFEYYHGGHGEQMRALHKSMSDKFRQKWRGHSKARKVIRGMRVSKQIGEASATTKRSKTELGNTFRHYQNQNYTAQRGFLAHSKAARDSEFKGMQTIHNAAADALGRRSRRTWEAMRKASDLSKEKTVNELSLGTLKSYATKARPHYERLAAHDFIARGKKEPYKKNPKLTNKERGLSRALHKIRHKEKAEQAVADKKEVAQFRREAKVRALAKRPGTPGEGAAAKAALKRWGLEENAALAEKLKRNGAMPAWRRRSGIRSFVNKLRGKPEEIYSANDRKTDHNDLFVKHKLNSGTHEKGYYDRTDKSFTPQHKVPHLNVPDLMTPAQRHAKYGTMSDVMSGARRSETKAPVSSVRKTLKFKTAAERARQNTSEEAEPVKTVKHYEIVRKAVHNGGREAVVGKAKTLKGARRAVDTHDNRYGAYAHHHRPIYEEEDKKKVTEDVGIYDYGNPKHKEHDLHKNGIPALKDKKTGKVHVGVVGYTHNELARAKKLDYDADHREKHFERGFYHEKNKKFVSGQHTALDAVDLMNKDQHKAWQKRLGEASDAVPLPGEDPDAVFKAKRTHKPMDPKKQKNLVSGQVIGSTGSYGGPGGGNMSY